MVVAAWGGLGVVRARYKNRCRQRGWAATVVARVGTGGGGSVGRLTYCRRSPESISSLLLAFGWGGGGQQRLEMRHGNVEGCGQEAPSRVPAAPPPWGVAAVVCSEKEKQPTLVRYGSIEVVSIDVG